MTISKPRSLNPRLASPLHKQLWKTTRSRRIYRVRESFRRRREFKPQLPKSHRPTRQSRPRRLTLLTRKPLSMEHKQKYRTLRRRSKPHKPTRKGHNSKESGREVCLQWLSQLNKNSSKWSPTSNALLRSSIAGKLSWRRLMPWSRAVALSSQKRGHRYRCANPSNNARARNCRVERLRSMRRSNSAQYLTHRSCSFGRILMPNRSRLKSRKLILITRKLLRQRMASWVSER